LPNLSQTFKTIHAEHFQIMSLWKSAMRSLSEASHEQPGYYLTGLTSCALAMERACKIILILDDLALKATTGQGSGIDRSTFQNGIRHDLWKALVAVSQVAGRRGITVSLPQRATTWQCDLLDLLNSISTGKCRYYSIDTLVGVPADDPLVKLHAIREKLILGVGLAQATTSPHAVAFAALVAHGTSILMHDLDGTSLTTERAVSLGLVVPRINKAIRGSLIETMKPLAELIMQFDYQCPDFPVGGDHYYWFWNDTSYLSRLKTWRS